MKNSQPEPTEGKPAFLRAPDAAARLGMSHSTFRIQVKAGRLPQPVRISPKRPVWKVRELDAFIESL